MAYELDKNKKGLVMGMGKTGISVVRFLLSKNYHFIVSDNNPLSEEAKQIIDENNIVFYNHQQLTLLTNIDYIIKSPGIKFDVPILLEAKNRSIPILSDIEVAYRFNKNEIVGITGTNGKTTTTTIVDSLLKSGNVSSMVAGNIGDPLCDVIKRTSEEDILIVELSSFQLLDIDYFKPKIAVILNLNEAHIDYHNSIDHYHSAKLKITNNLKSDDYLIINGDDEKLTNLTKNMNCNIIYFSIKNKVEGAYIKDKGIYFYDEYIARIEDIFLPGSHNLANILAAICVAKIYNVNNDSINRVIKNFRGVKHRLQFLGNFEGVKIYNDSKATNPTATNASLYSFNQEVILIAGGLDRGIDFQEMTQSLQNCKYLISFGESKYKLSKVAEMINLPYKIVETLEEAVNFATTITTENDILLFSPACASWDQYKNFEQRGDSFINAVEQAYTKKASIY